MSNHCIFCKIINREMASAIVYEDDKVLAFNDIKPAAPVHVLIVPKNHVDSTEEVPEDDPIISTLTNRAVKIAAQLGLREGYRLVINQGDNGGQTVYHLHLHLMGGRFMGWPPG